jgi:uncharacterized membrane protein YeaQ/YmgE (transglycosylase-associated protein family)
MAGKMTVEQFIRRTGVKFRLRRTLLIFLVPLVLAAIIPIVITVVAQSPSFIGWILLIGVIAGWIAGRVFHETRMAVLADIVAGVMGAFVAAWVFAYFRKRGIEGSHVYSIVVAALGAIGTIVALVAYRAWRAIR